MQRRTPPRAIVLSPTWQVNGHSCQPELKTKNPEADTWPRTADRESKSLLEAGVQSGSQNELEVLRGEQEAM